MRFNLPPQRLISPPHQLAPDAPVSRSIIRKRSLGERAVMRTTTNAGHSHTWSPGDAETSMDEDHRHLVETTGGQPEVLDANDHGHTIQTGAKPLGEVISESGPKFSKEQAFADHAYENVGVFIRLPEFLATQWPKNPKDSSPPHITMLYVGACPQAKYDLVLEAVREVCRNLEPFTLDISDYGEFVANKPGVAPEKSMTIAHMVPRLLTGSHGLAEIHEKLWAACEKRGVTCDHFRDGPFKPHVTLDYRQPGAKPYDGPRPQGRWAVSYLDLWGTDPESDYGYRKLPLGSSADGGPKANEKPKAELVSDSIVPDMRARFRREIG